MKCTQPESNLQMKSITDGLTEGMSLLDLLQSINRSPCHVCKYSILGQVQFDGAAELHL